MTQENQDTDANERALMGGNNPPPYNPETYQKFSDGLDRFNVAAKVWQDIDEVKDEDQAEKLNDFLTGAKLLKSQIEKARVADKKPHFDAGKAVDAAYKSLDATLQKVDDAIRPKLGQYMENKRQAQLKIKAEEERVAKEAAAEAERKVAAAEADKIDIRAQQEAEDAVEKAEKAEKAAKKQVKTNVGSATGGGRTASYRPYRSAKIVAIAQVFIHYKERPEVHDLLKRLADADIRSAAIDDSKIPGIKIVETQKAV